VSTLWKVEGLFGTEQPFDEAIEFLAAHQCEGSKPNARRFSFDSRQAKRRVSILVPCEPVPQAPDHRADQFIRRVDRRKFQQLAAP
jgi:hypothetical protein